MQSKSEIAQLVINQAVAFGRNPSVILALVSIESDFDPHACRFEPNFRWTDSPQEFAKINRITKQTEELLQKCSIGLMQIMGGTARSLLLYRDQLAKLFDPVFNLELGLKHFTDLQQRYPNNTLDVIAAWNAGSVIKERDGNYKNQEYVNKFEGALEYYHENLHKHKIVEV
jgi:soluble lytic murein transglycosylase-like protein